MKGEFKIEVDMEDPMDRDEIRKVANYQNAYMALYDIKKYIENKLERATELEEIVLKDIYDNLQYFLADNCINIDRDVK